MSSILKFVTVLVVLTLAYDAEVQAQGCTSLPPKENFRVKDFLGKWYEQRRYVKIGNENPKCVSSVDKLDVSGDGDIYDSSFRELAKVNGTWTPVNISSKVKFIRKDVGKFELTFAGQYKSNNGVYIVLDTDYTSYYVTASCDNGNVKGDNKVFAWIYTREANPANSVVEQGLKVAEKAGLNTKKFFKISQKGCNHVNL